jgi:hypothetical protein
VSAASPDALRRLGWPLPVALLLLAAWLGAALYFAAVVTRASFVTLPTRALAGALVSHILPPLLDAGLVVGFWLAAAALLAPRGRVRSWSLAGGLGIVALCGIARFVILARIERLRLSMPASIEALPPGDPMRHAFGQLHALSVGALGLAMLIGIAVAIVLLHSFAVLVHD